MKRWLGLSLGLFLVGCSAAGIGAGNEIPSAGEEAVSQPLTETLPNFGQAPELVTDTWINSNTPYRLADLKGQVVLIEMWTLGCSNCKNVIPSLIDWHEKYAESGLVIIGNHYPEFQYEEDLETLNQAVSDYGIKYAVTQDNEGKNWRAYQNRYWPTLYLIDKEGYIRYQHIGEGNYEKTEKVIQALLAQSN